MLKKHVVLVLTVVFSVLYVLVLALIFRCIDLVRRQRRRRALQLLQTVVEIIEDEINDQSTGAVALDLSILATLPKFAYTTPVPVEDGKATPPALEYCAVCLGVAQEGELIRVLPNCMHMFHVDCVDMWLHTNSTCPVCRAGVAPAAQLATFMQDEGEASTAAQSRELKTAGSV